MNNVKNNYLYLPWRSLDQSKRANQFKYTRISPLTVEDSRGECQTALAGDRMELIR